MKEGVDILANAVKATLGPAGRNVLIRTPSGKARITKDGVTVAKVIELKDKLQDMGARIVKEAATKTVDLAGDGTTTSTLLAQEMITLGLDALSKDANPVEIKKGMDIAISKVVAHIRDHKKPLDPENMEWVATISANNNPEIGRLVCHALNQVGVDGTLTLENSKTTEDHFEKVEGLRFDRGYIHPAMVNNSKKMAVDFENPYILLCERKISSHTDLTAAWKIAHTHKRPLLIIAEDVDGDALGTIIATRAQTGQPLAAIKLPGFGNMQLQTLEDVACITGGKVVSEMKGEFASQIDVSYLGTAKNVIITATTTTIVGGGGARVDIERRIEEVKALIENHDNEYEKDKIKKQRLAKLVNGVGILYVGAQTEVEQSEKKDRIDDALCATKAALEEGVVPGGGVAYLRAAETLSPETLSPDQQKGMEIVRKSLFAPIYTILNNAGLNPEEVVDRIATKSGYDVGYNVKSGKIEHFFLSGVIDAAKVTRVALENAGSVASMFLTMECAIVDDDSK